MLIYLEETSLFDSPAQTLVNSVNTVGVMGKGIAAAFKRLYPGMYLEYNRLCEQNKLQIGRLHIYRTLNKLIVNFPTKRHWRQPSKLEYVEKGLLKFVQSYMKVGISSVSFPQLGCGNGELDWPGQVQPMMEKYLKNLPIPVYVHLYCLPSNFKPERLDPVYAKEVLLERQRISAQRLWNDLKQVVQDEGYLFSPIQISEEAIIFGSETDSATIADRDEISMLWDKLRQCGTLGINEIPTSIDHRAGKLLFDLLRKLDYIKPVHFRSRIDGLPMEGLRYYPPPEKEEQRTEEVLV